jgi:hypothetical protein
MAKLKGSTSIICLKNWYNSINIRRNGCNAPFVKLKKQVVDDSKPIDVQSRVNQGVAILKHPAGEEGVGGLTVLMKILILFYLVLGNMKTWMRYAFPGLEKQ